MIINKFKLFESLSIGAIERGEHIAIINESENLDEGILSSITNFFSRMLGGSVAKLDKIIRKYKENELDYWTNWADTRGRNAEAEVLSKEAKSDPVQKMKYTEQLERLKKLETQVEERRNNVNDALVRQATLIIKDSERLKDYWEMKKAAIDEDVAKESFDEVKKSTDNDTIHDLFDTQIQRAAKIAKQKDAEFKAKYGTLSSGSFFDQAPPEESDLSVAGIKIQDLISKPLNSVQGKLKELTSDRLEDVLKFIEKELKKIKDQREDDIRSAKSHGDKAQQNKEIEDITKKVKFIIDNLQTKADYIDQLILSSKGIKQDIKSNPEIVTDITKKELGTEGTDKAVVTAIAQAAEVSKPSTEKVEMVITDQVKKNFENAKGTIEEAVGTKIDAEAYKHLKNDLIALYGKLVFFYTKLNKNVPSKTMEFGLIDFATQLYKFKASNNLLNKDLSSAELEKQFDKYEK